MVLGPPLSRTSGESDFSLKQMSVKSNRPIKRESVKPDNSQALTASNSRDLSFGDITTYLRIYTNKNCYNRDYCCFIGRNN